MYLQSSDPLKKSAVCRLVITLSAKMRSWIVETHCKTSQLLYRTKTPNANPPSSDRTCKISATAS